jgi:hypothetical protein
MSLLDKASLVVTPNAYKASKLYSVVPNTTLGDMTVVRATTATRVNSLGLIESVAVNVPRIDYTNGSCPSLLVEGQRTNLATNSDGNVSTYPGFINVTNASSSFNSFTNAIQFPNTALALAYKPIVTTAQTYTISVFIKMDDNSVPILSASQTTGNVSLVIAGAVVTNNLKVESYGNNVYRLSGTATSAGLNLNNGVVRYATQVLKSFKITGIQLEAASYPTSYIPTVASTTRNADVISKTGISSLIGQTQGVLYAEVIIKNTENQICASIQRDGGINHIFISQENNKPKFSVRANNISIFSYSNGVFLNGINKVALAYNTNGIVSAFLNGVKVSTISTSAFTFSNTLSTLQLFDDGYYSLDNTSIKNSTILFKTALTNAELAQLTTI